MAQITKSEFINLMQMACFKDEPARVVVACSGGPDSMALALLVRDWSKHTGSSFVAVIVDHKLRDNSTAEAALVKTRLEENGVKAQILTRKNDGEITSDVQNKARRIRYHLLKEYCCANDIQALLTGHHQEDQAETFLLRLARGSGVDGLSAMNSIGAIGSIKLIRPLLGKSKKDILDTLDVFGVPAVNDPSNANENFGRVKMRNRQSLFDEVGLTTKRLVDTAKNMARARSALEQVTQALLQSSTTLYPEGYCKLDTLQLIKAPEEIALRALSRVLVSVSGRDYPPRLEQVERLLASLLKNEIQGGCTLAGCGVTPKGAGLLIFREFSAITDSQKITRKMLWDGRFSMHFETIEGSIKCQKMGTDGWRQLKQVIEKDCEFPAVIRNGLPALWRGDELVSVPHVQGLKHAKNYGLTELFLIAGKNF